MTELSQTVLGDHVEILTGYPFRSADFSDHVGDIRLLRGDNIGQGRLRWENAKRWPESDVSVLDFAAKPGDVILAMDRPWIEAGLKFAVVKPDDVPSLLVQRVARIRALDGLDQRFLGILIGSQAFTNHVLGVQTGTAVPHISATQIREFRFPLPTLREQQRIAGVLGVLDDLIDANERLASDLEALARTMGRTFVAGLREPDGTTLISDIARIDKGFSYKSSELVEGGGWLVGLKNVGRDGSFRSDGFKPLSAAVKPTQIVDTGDLVVAHTDLTQARDVIGRPVRVRRGSRTGQLVASLDLAVVRPRVGMTVEYLQAVLETAEFREHALAFCNGTTVLHMASAAVPSFPVTIPSADRLVGFSSRVKALQEGADSLREEAEGVRSARTELLPLLIAGHIRVADIKELVT